MREQIEGARRVAKTAQEPRGMVVVLSGPSGSGKTTICRRLARDYGYRVSISATTRPARQGEREGEDYFFLTRQQFEDRVKKGYFLEHAEYLGHLYGTPREQVERALQEKRVILLAIDVQGAEQVMRIFPEALHIFIVPPDQRELERRLRSRETENEQGVQRRLQRAQEEMKYAAQYHHVVENDDLDRAVLQVRELIEAKRRMPKNG